MLLIVGGFAAFASNDTNKGGKNDEVKVELSTDSSIPDFNLNEGLVLLVAVPSCEADWMPTPAQAAANGAYQVGPTNHQPEGDYITMESECVEWTFSGTTWIPSYSTRRHVYFIEVN